MRGTKRTTGALLFILFLIGVQCKGDKQVAPKPRAYPKVVYQEKAYRLLDTSFCPFRAMIPGYANVKRKENYFDEQLESECWLNIEFPFYDAMLHCSYDAIDSPARFDKLKTDAFKLVDKHNVRAKYIDRYAIQKENGVSGFLFKIEGPVASATQFYLTDSTDHFFRASLYFNTRVNRDSLAPVQAFIDEDINRFIESFEWRE